MTDLDEDPRLYAPDGIAWCAFGYGLLCTNGRRCRNPNHRIDDREAAKHVFAFLSGMAP